MRFFQVTVPEDKAHMVMKVLMKSRARLGIRRSAITKTHSTNSFVISFRLRDSMVITALSVLQDDARVGREFGMIDILPLDVVKPNLPDPGGEGFFQGDRLTGEEILSSVSSGANLNFDIAVLLIAASLIAGAGLASDSSVVVVASMLVSPLMGPILAFTLGPIAKDRVLTMRGVYYECVMVMAAIYVGGMLAFLFLPFGDRLGFPTEEMSSRGNPWNLLFGILVAVPSGAGVALSISSGAVGSLVGVAISASLLPPCVNTGLAIVFGILDPVLFGSTAYPDMIIVGIVSFVLVSLNIVCLTLVGHILFRIKNVKAVVGASHKYNWNELVDDSAKQPLDGMELDTQMDEFDVGHDPIGEYLLDRGRAPKEGGASLAPLETDRMSLAKTTDVIYDEVSFSPDEGDEEEYEVPTDGATIHPWWSPPAISGLFERYTS